VALVWRYLGDLNNTGTIGVVGMTVLKAIKQSSTTVVACTGYSCTATVTGAGPNTKAYKVKGTVTMYTGGTGTFSTPACTNPSYNVLKCTTTYTPSVSDHGSVLIGALYPATGVTGPSSGYTHITVS
jgi:hypothetical protein